jgi:diguanylate cyclase (GGDEF)-like protein
MRISSQRVILRDTVEATLESFVRPSLRGLAFPKLLEDRFEQDTRLARSHRMWFEGLVAIFGFNLCLLVDFLFVNDGKWLSIVYQTAIATPVALAVNALVRSNPSRPVREGGVALGMFIICVLNLVAEGRASASATLFGAICTLVTAMFAAIVMRLRFKYSVATISAMLIASIWSIGNTQQLSRSEAVMADSILAIGIAIILVASISLELEERNGYLIGLQRDVQAEDLAWANQALKELSDIDNLTRLPNRRALDERVALLWQSCAARNQPLSAVVIDVDHFKLFNDNHGHLFGDEILRQIGALLPQALRSADHMAARFGGEEFVLLLPGARPDEATAIADAVRRLICASIVPARPLSEGKAMAPITVSCGVSTVLPGHILQWMDLISAADAALYEAKRGGRNRVEFRRCLEPRVTADVIEIRPASTVPRGARTTSRSRNFGSGILPGGNPISKLISRF